MINGKDQTHAPSPRPPAVTSNSQCWTSIIVKHKEIAAFSSSILHIFIKESKKISNDQELIQSYPISCPQNQKGNN